MKTAMASRVNAMNIVFSRPMWSDTQPQNGRVKPLRTRSTSMASTTADIPNAIVTWSTL